MRNHIWEVKEDSLYIANQKLKHSGENTLNQLIEFFNGDELLIHQFLILPHKFFEGTAPIRMINSRKGQILIKKYIDSYKVDYVH